MFKIFFFNMKWQSLLSKLAAFGTCYIWGIITISGFITSHNFLLLLLGAATFHGGVTFLSLQYLSLWPH